MDAYKSWVRANYSWLSSVENAASALTWLLPERLAHSELAPETLSTLLGMFSVVNEHIVSSAPRSQTYMPSSGSRWGGLPPEGVGGGGPGMEPPMGLPSVYCGLPGGGGLDGKEGMGEARVSKQQPDADCPAWAASMPWPLMLSLSKEMENLIELVAEQFAGKDGKWSVVAVVEAIKVLTRFTILRASRGRMLINGGTEANEGEEDGAGGGGDWEEAFPLSRMERRRGGGRGVGLAGRSGAVMGGRALGFGHQQQGHEEWWSRVREGDRRGEGVYWEGEGISKSAGGAAAGGGGFGGGGGGWCQPIGQVPMEDDQRVLAFKAFNRFRAKALQGVNAASWASSRGNRGVGEWEREEGGSHSQSSVVGQAEKKKSVVGGGRLAPSSNAPHGDQWVRGSSEMTENGIRRGGGGGEGGGGGRGSDPTWQGQAKHAYPPFIPAHDAAAAAADCCGIYGSIWAADERCRSLNSPVADGRGSVPSSATPVPLSRNPTKLSPCSPLTWTPGRPAPDSPSSTADRSSNSPRLPRSGSGSSRSGSRGGEDDEDETTSFPQLGSRSLLVYSQKMKQQMMELYQLGLSRMRGYAESTAASLSFSDLPPDMRVGRQALLAAEMLFILRPLIYVLAIRRYGAKAWRPWFLSLSVDLFSLILQNYGEAVCEGKGTKWGIGGGGGGGEQLSQEDENVDGAAGGAERGRQGSLSRREREELVRRRIHLLFYLIRSPFFDVVTRRPIAVTERVMKPVPLLGTLTRKAVEILMGIQAYYFYTAAS
ncbi:hypothetical protein CBR_g3181 [Chara braunii]|uniref:Peroxisomal membrane protein PEX16 n=1 Tax=Chara braunii TaxID=69332 RepID=A0A388KF16_CHABU|nr:hypothetical protein CBR_g3181 [Chara braunii]|eukprot:GBG68640.1 hypothetical protein CBR_g3181 [Chara braunii]